MKTGQKSIYVHKVVKRRMIHPVVVVVVVFVFLWHRRSNGTIFLMQQGAQ